MSTSRLAKYYLVVMTKQPPQYVVMCSCPICEGSLLIVFASLISTRDRGISPTMYDKDKPFSEI